MEWWVICILQGDLTLHVTVFLKNQPFFFFKFYPFKVRTAHSYLESQINKKLTALCWCHILDSRWNSLEHLIYYDIWGFLNSVSKLLNIILLRTIHQSKDAQGTTN